MTGVLLVFTAIGVGVSLCLGGAAICGIADFVAEFARTWWEDRKARRYESQRFDQMRDLIEGGK